MTVIRGAAPNMGHSAFLSFCWTSGDGTSGFLSRWFAALHHFLRPSLPHLELEPYCNLLRATHWVRRLFQEMSSKSALLIAWKWRWKPFSHLLSMFILVVYMSNQHLACYAVWSQNECLVSHSIKRQRTTTWSWLNISKRIRAIKYVGGTACSARPEIGTPLPGQTSRSPLSALRCQSG